MHRARQAGPGPRGLHLLGHVYRFLEKGLCATRVRRRGPRRRHLIGMNRSVSSGGGPAAAGLTRGSNRAAASPSSPTPARVSIAAAYAPLLRPATRMVPAIAVPREDPRFDTHLDRPEISPCRSSPKLDWTTLIDGVSIRCTPNPSRNRPGTNAQALLEADTMRTSTTMPRMVRANPAMTSVRVARVVAKPTSLS